MPKSPMSASSRERPNRRSSASGVLERHRFAPVVESLREHPSFISRPMFGCVACYVQGRLVLVVADRREPWRGLLVPTSRETHGALVRELPELREHPVLRKWLYLPEASSRFTETAQTIVQRILAGDSRIGVEAKAPRLPSRRRR